MTIAADPRTGLELSDDELRSRGGLSAIWGFAWRNPLGAAGALVIIVMFVVAVFAEVIAPYDPVANAFDEMHEPPSLAHWSSASCRRWSARASGWSSEWRAPTSAAAST